VLPADKTGELLAAELGFGLVVFYHPGCQRQPKDLKPRTRQGVVALDFGLPTPKIDANTVAREGDAPLPDVGALVHLPGCDVK
jgi:hypothetical protein